MRFSTMGVAAFVVFGLAACTKKSSGPVVVPDSALKPTPVSTGKQPQGGDTTTNMGTPETQAQTLPPETADGTILPPSGSATEQSRPEGTAPQTGDTARPPASSGGSATKPPATGAQGQSQNQAGAQQSLGGGKTNLGGLTVGTPAGFAITQQAANDGIVLVGFAKGEDYAAIYAKPGAGATPQSLFVNDAKVTTPEAAKKIGNYDWKVIETTKTVAAGLPHAGTYYVTGFMMEKGGTTYYGYGKSTSAELARAAAEAVMSAAE